MHGLWRLLFTALCVSALVWGLGCRPASPPPAPRRGWVDLEALAAMHPSARLAEELTQQIAQLERQHARLVSAPMSPLPSHRTAEITELPALPAPPALPALPIPSVAPLLAEETRSMRTTLTTKHARELVRHKRVRLGEDARQLQHELLALEREAATAEHLLGRQWRLPIRDGELELETTSLLRGRYPASLLLGTRYEQASATLVQMHTTFDEELRKLSLTHQRAIQAAQEKQTAQLNKDLSAKTEQYQQDADARVAEEAKRWQTLEALVPPLAPPAPLAFSPLPLAPTHPALGPLPALIEGIDRATLAQRRTAADALALRSTTLRRQRHALRIEAREATWQTLQDLAQLHGVHITTERRGPDLTARAGQWLSAYWPTPRAPALPPASPPPATGDVIR
jgi:hypothetical protein